MRPNLLSEIQLVNIVVSAAIIIGVVLVTLAVIFYSMVTDLRQRAVVSAGEIDAFLQYPLYIVDDDQAVRIAETFLSSGKISGIVLESTTAGVLLSKQIGKDSQRIPQISRDIYHEDVLVGRFTIMFSDQEVFRALSRLAILSILIGVTVFAAIASANRLLISKKVSRAFAPILSGIKSFSNGSYETSITPTPFRDVNTLVNHFNDMANKIRQKDLEQEKIMDKLAAERQYLMDIIDFLPDATFVIDTEKNVVAWNRAIESMTRVSRDDVIGKGDYEYALPFFGERRPMLIDLVDTPDEKHSKIYKYLRRKGSAIFAESYIPNLDEGRGAHLWGVAAPLFDRNGTRTGAIELIRDVTDYKKTEMEKHKLQAQLLQSQKMEAIGTLAGGIAHDFNNILTAIIGYTEIALTHQMASDAPLRTNLENVLKAGLRAKDLVKQILTFSRQTEPELRPLEINVIIKEVTKLLRSSLPSTIEIRHNIQSNLLVLGDPTQLHQILMNLCTNAGHAMQAKGGLLTIESQNVEIKAFQKVDKIGLKPGLYVRLSVSDTGYGIPAKLLDRIYDPFFTTKDQDEGTGMGLAVVHGIVQSCQGAINVESQQGRGTTFNVFLPAIQKHADTEILKAVDLPRGDEHILLVDDEPTIVDIVTSQLESLGYQVTTRHSSLEALEFIKRKADSFDLVVTDMTMPKMTGDQLAVEIKRIKPDLPVVLCTGFSSHLPTGNHAAKDFDAVLMKPILLSELAEVVRSVIDHKYTRPSGAKV